MTPTLPGDFLVCPDCLGAVEVLGLGIGSPEDCDDAMLEHRDATGCDIYRKVEWSA